ncbi:hypothetical protein [Gordonia sp. CPCC 205333]|uniref:hypothetical protein n=1 Tax=Gordonia sp. CPCC 205333 TaxID=3140790 RepID=UPI003AF3ABCB
MAETGARPPERQRLRKLAQAAMNADMTVEQVQTILVDMGEVLGGMDSTMGALDTTLGTFDESLTRLSTTMDRVDGMAQRLNVILGRMEAIVERAEKLVVIVEVALSPIGVIESAGRQIASRFGIVGKR